MKKHFRVPTWSLSAIINDDWSGLLTDERAQLKEFLNGLPKGSFSPPDDEDEPYLHGSNAINNLAGEVIILTYVYDFNPYLDSDFKDLTKDAERLSQSVLVDIHNDPHYYAELVSDLYFHWKHNTFETPLMTDFHTAVLIKQAERLTGGIHTIVKD
jgi:hypothetical protein